MQSELGTLVVHDVGTSILLGFRGKTATDENYFVQCSDWIRDLVESVHCRSLTFDLTDVERLSNAALKFLVRLHSIGLKIFVYNASTAVCQLLQITKMDRMIRSTTTPYA